MFLPKEQEQIQIWLSFFEKNIKKYKSNLNKLKKYRDKYLSHFDNKYFKDKEKANDKDFYLTIKEMQDLIFLANILISRLTEILENSPINLNFDISDEIKLVFGEK